MSFYSRQMQSVPESCLTESDILLFNNQLLEIMQNLDVADEMVTQTVLYLLKKKCLKPIYRDVD